MLRDFNFRRTTCRLAAAAILFAQIVVSAHACPRAIGNDSATVPALTMDSSHQPGSMAECDMIDPSADMSLQCSEHCKYGQRADQMRTVTIPMAVFNCLYPVGTPVVPGVATRSSCGEAAIGPSPPHAILHCCLRI